MAVMGRSASSPSPSPRPPSRVVTPASSHWAAKTAEDPLHGSVGENWVEDLELSKMNAMRAVHEQGQRRFVAIKQRTQRGRNLFIAQRHRHSWGFWLAEAQRATTFGLKELEVAMQLASFEADFETRKKRFTEEASIRSRSAMADHEERRQRLKELEEEERSSKSHQFTQVAQKQRELFRARLAAVEDIERMCRRHRTLVPNSPHQPRATFQRLRPLPPRDPRSVPPFGKRGCRLAEAAKRPVQSV